MNINIFIIACASIAGVLIGRIAFKIIKFNRRPLSKIESMVIRNKREIERISYAIAPGFWRPILSRWLVWLGAAWSVGSVLVFAPFITKAIKGMF